MKTAIGSLVLLLSALFSSAPAAAAYLQCAPFAREVSGIQLFGNAGTWWGKASGKYDRGEAPKVGAVLVFKETGSMRVGHVAMVSRIVSAREIKITHANWSVINGRRGQIERDVTVVDASPAGDWSQVKVWYAPIGKVGTKAYPVYGFVYNDKPLPEMRMASAAPAADAPAMRGMLLASVPTRTLLP
nr:CHAP domain-containing protein [Sphingomonas bacterium]